MESAPDVVTAVGRALREARFRLGVSQRDLATRLGVGKTMIGRLENGDGLEVLARVAAVLERLGFGLTVIDLEPPATAAGAPDESRSLVEAWRRRVDDEEVRDAAGRRPPAHATPVPLRVPHWWWVVRHPGTPWADRPTWTWQRRPVEAHVAKRLGVNPPPSGLPPRGGAPMQGWPTTEWRWTASPPRPRARQGSSPSL